MLRVLWIDRRRLLSASIACAAALAVAAAAEAGGAADPLCTASYGGDVPRGGPALRFGVDPGIAGSAVLPLAAVPDDPAKTLTSLVALRPPGKSLVLRLNRLFWSDGEAGLDEFRAAAARYAAAGFDVEVQVRYHPPAGHAGDLAAWVAYVRHVVDVLGPNRRVVAMTITNEANLAISPNTSDGYYQGARDAVVQGIVAAHDEARRHGFSQLRFGFTYAYRFLPTDDTAFFTYLNAHGGPAFAAAVDWIGLDFYPGGVFPPVILPGDSYRATMAQALGVLRGCFAPLAGIGPAVPIWVTENGVATTPLPGSEQQQLAAMRELVQAAHDYRGTYNVSDYRWFNLRDNTSSSPASLIAATFSSDGLLRDDYSPKPSFAGYRDLVAALGADETTPPPPGSAGPGPLAPTCRVPALRVRLARSRAPIVRVRLYLGRRRVASSRGRNLRVVVLPRPPAHAFALTAVIELRGGASRRLRLRYRFVRRGSCGFVTRQAATAAA